MANDTEADRLIADLNAVLDKYPNLRLYVGGYECDFEIENLAGPNGPLLIPETVVRLQMHQGHIERVEY